MATVKFDAVTRLYPGTQKAAVNDVSLDIADGEFLVLVGPSGSGKSTLLRLLAGLEPVDSGHVEIGGADVTGVPAKDRDIALVFQNYALYPHMSVEQNISFSLKVAKVPAEERSRRVGEVARLLGLEELLARKPRALSGGQRQRVAMGRAIVREPQVFLLDEPLSNLDAQLRVQTRAEIAKLQHRLGVTTVYVTHDQTEALTLGDRIAVLRDGVLQQLGTPRELLDAPKNTFVAGFIGSPAINLIEVPVVESGVRIGSEVLPRLLGEGEATRERVTIGVRPEDLRLVSADSPGLQLTVDLVEELGADGYLFGSIADESDARSDSTIVVRVDGRSHPAPGDTVTVSPKIEHLHLFDIASGERL